MMPPPIPPRLPAPLPPPHAPPLPVPATEVTDLTPAPAPEKTLRQLYLTLFLRGYSARGLQNGRQKNNVPKSVGQKLAFILVIYFFTGCVSIIFIRQPLFALSLWMHGMTFVILGMYVAASAGEILFNQQEADILLHRPVSPRSLLWAKVGVLVQVSLWLAGAFNLVGLFVGLASPDGGWRYPLADAASTMLEALLCTGTVVLSYQLCLRWFGRERLNNLMTGVQVVVAVAAVAGGQIVPRVIDRFTGPGLAGNLTSDTWWLALLPPAWFAGFDDALAGTGSLRSWLLAVTGLLVTGVVLWLAFGKLAEDYAAGLQSLGETTAPKPAKRARRRWLDRLVEVPPLSWWLRDSVERASFLLTAAYLARDRDVKLRVYPSVAPILVMPFIMLTQHGGHDDAADSMGGAFMSAFVGMYMAYMPLLLIGLLQISQNWQAADLFRVVPLPGPTPLFNGVRRAVMLIITLPLTLFFGLLVWLVAGRHFGILLLLLPGIILLPLYSLIPGLGGRSVPLSQPIETAKAAKRSLGMVMAGIIPMILAGVVMLSWKFGWIGWFLLFETVVVAVGYAIMRAYLKKVRWPALE